MKKRLFLIILFLIMFTIIPMSVSAADITFTFCQENTLKVFKIVSTALTILKIVIPLLLIIFGVIDMGKAVIASDDKATKNAINILMKRAIAGVIIFFIPTIIKFIFGIVYNVSDPENIKDFKKCTDCLLDISKCK